MAYKENDVKEASKATAKGSVKVRIIGGEEMSMADYHHPCGRCCQLYRHAAGVPHQFRPGTSHRF